MPHGDALNDTDTVPQELEEIEGDIDGEPDALTVSLLTLVTDGLYEDDTVDEDENVVEIVDDVEGVYDPDGLKDTVAHDDNVGEIVDDVDTVPDTD